MGGKVSNFIEKHWRDILGWSLMAAGAAMFMIAGEGLSSDIDLIFGDPVVDVEEVDVCPDQYFLGKYSELPIEPSANRLNISEDGIINIGVEDSVSNEYYWQIAKACGFLNDVFKVINPNIKFDIKRGVTEQDEVRVSKEKEESDSGAIMTVFQYIDKETPARLAGQAEYKIYPKADTQTTNHNKVACIHELMHVLGLNDHNDKHYQADGEREEGCENKTIMNYADVASLGHFDKYGFYETDYVSLVNIYGAKNSEEAVALGYESYEQYMQVVNDNIEKFCIMSAFDKNDYEMK